VEKRQFGSTKRSVAVVGQGTWEIESGDRKAAVAAIRRGLDLGMTHIDTAEMYGKGLAEEIVGEAIESRRDEVFLVSKVLPTNASRKGTVAACDKSLMRLRTDRLDCYLLHWRGKHDLDETITALEQLERDGKILSWGVSNFDVEDLEAALEIAGEGRIACNQVLYHLKERAIEHAVLPWCNEHGVALVAYSPFGQANGFPAPKTKGSQVLQEVATAHGATPRQVALRFLMREQAVFTIPKAASVEHLAENAAAGDLQLSAAELAAIDAAFPLGKMPGSLPMI
jgi:diketogulonate reductase-like aldo/keto reductase